MGEHGVELPRRNSLQGAQTQKLIKTQLLSFNEWSYPTDNGPKLAVGQLHNMQTKWNRYWKQLLMFGLFPRSHFLEEASLFIEGKQGPFSKKSAGSDKLKRLLYFQLKCTLFLQCHGQCTIQIPRFWKF